MSPMRAMLAEFVGTFALMFVGGGAIIMSAGAEPGVHLIIIAMAHGLILSVMVSATIHLSGAQFNPAVSIALALVKMQPWMRALMFIVAQLVGSIAAAWLLKSILTNVDGAVVGNVGATLGALSTGEQADALKVLGLEIIATFFLMFVIAGSAGDGRSVTKPVAGFAIGLTVAANILFFGPLTGASMNPARSFGPALVAGAWDMHWVYWVAPIVGAALAATAYKAVFGLPAAQE